MKTVTVATPDCTFEATATRALYWPDERVITVSDLHLGKSERASRRSGQLLPPYETEDTLHRLTEVFEYFKPKRVICLGDSFDDLVAAQHLTQSVIECINSLMQGRDWIWIEGNHDPSPTQFGGQTMRELEIGPNIFRHITDLSAQKYELSGHYHPKARISVKGTSMTRPCFVFDEKRLILPSFGTYTGGLYCTEPAISGIMERGAKAILIGTAPHIIPMPR